MPRNMYRVSDSAADLLSDTLSNIHLAMFQFVKVLEWHVTSDAIFSNGM